VVKNQAFCQNKNAGQQFGKHFGKNDKFG